VSPLPPLPGLAKIIVKQTLASVNVFNVFHAISQGGVTWTSTEATNMATAIRSAWVTNLIPLQSTGLTLTDVTVIDLSTDSGVEGSATGSTPGTVVAQALPASAAICWSWKISKRYRGGHPRTYIAGLTGTDLSNANTVSAARVTSHTNAANAIKTAIQGVIVGGNAAYMVVPHYVKNKVQLPVPDFSYINSVAVDTRVDSQRRRLGRDR